VDGMTNREIAQALFVTQKTVEWHLAQAYQKLGIGRRTELVRVLGPGETAGMPVADRPVATLQARR
jgi:DNA-binding NarL/FixJ family response regulator